MKKRIGCLILVLTFIFVFAACGNDSGTSQTTTPQAASTQAASTQPETSKLDPVELVMAFTQITATPKDLQLVNDEINKITKEKINATIKMMPISISQYGQQIRLMLAGKEKLDLLSGGTLAPGIVFDLANQVANGQLYPLNDLLDKYGQGIKDALGDYIDAASIDGKIYEVATVRDMAQSDSIAIRKDLVEKYGIDTSKIKSLTDLEPIFEIIKEKEPGMVPYHFNQDATGTISNIRTIGGDNLGDNYGVLVNMQDKELKVVNWFETPEYKSLIELARKWYKADYVSKSAATLTETSQARVKADTLFSYMQAWKPGIDSQVIKQCEKPMMTVPIDQATATTAGVTSFGWVIPNYAKNPERSMMFLNLMYSDAEIVNLIDWGIEGKHYVKQPDGTIDFPQGVTNETNGYAMNQGFVFGNQLLSHVFKGDDPTLWKQMDEFNKSAIKSVALGFMFNNEPVKTEIAAVTNVFNEYSRPLETGSIDPAVKLPEFISKLKAAGIDKIIAEKQKQLDEWAKKKGLK